MNNNLHRTFGIIGRPLGHSFSADYFNRKFHDEGIDACYLKFELPDIGDLMELFAEHDDIAGLNVTIPYKQAVIPYMDEMDADAARIGAVNVIKVTGQGADMRLKGYNSDIIGFVDSIRPLLTPRRNRALVLGTGGASKAVRQGLLNLGVQPVMVSRTAREGVITYDEITPELMASHLVIVNTTPLGMSPDVDTCAPIPYDCLTPDHLCYDVVYNPSETLFLRKSAEHGAEVKNGMEMLLGQAVAAWNIWNA